MADSSSFSSSTAAAAAAAAFATSDAFLSNEQNKTNKEQVLFQDTSTDCAICLCPLYDNDNDDDDHNDGQDMENSNVITLHCGHKWHLHCIKQQLEHAQPSHSKRLLFHGCSCPKCGVFCNHSALEHFTRKTDYLRQKVDALIVEQLQIDEPQVWKQAVESSKQQQQQQQEMNSNNNNDNNPMTALIEQGRRKYAFYLCNSCQEPYFGGTVECADAVGVAGTEEELPPQDRLCVSCRPQSQTICQHPLNHRGHLTWKCRYCCQIATFVCYGTVHFCSSCHARNSKHVSMHRQRQRQQQSHGLRTDDSTGRPILEPIPCPGGNSCPFPKPLGQEKHSNGSTSECEQVYQCGLCTSSSSTSSQSLPFGSPNLVVNPNGEQGLWGWQQLNRQMSWQVETSELPLVVDSGSSSSTTTNPPSMITTNFVSSFAWCVMVQSIPLGQFLDFEYIQQQQQQDPSSNSNIRIEVAAHYMGRTDCPSVFRLEAVILNSNKQPIGRQLTPELDTAPDCWERASLVLEVPISSLLPPSTSTLSHRPTANASSPSVVVMVYGKDSRFWQGTFGSKVTNCSVRILASSLEELQERYRFRIPISDNNNNNVDNNTMFGNLRFRGPRQQQQQQQQQQRQQNRLHRDQRHPPQGHNGQERVLDHRYHLFVNGLLPMVCLVVFFLFTFW